MIITLHELSFAHESSSKNILNALNLSFSPGFTSLIGPNGCGKSTLLRLLAGELMPTAGHISRPAALLSYCHQETPRPPKDLATFLAATDRVSLTLKGALSLHNFSTEQTHFWQNLSSGEQKRLQLACALYKEPDVLLIDEPTNHLDAANRTAIITALRLFRGIGVLVSHDRELLDAITNRCVFFVGSTLVAIGGNYSAAKQELETKLAYAASERDIAKRQMQRLKKEVTRIEQITQQSPSKLSKRGISAKDHDQKSRIDAARLTGKEKSLDQKKQNLSRRVDNLHKRAASFNLIPDYGDHIIFPVAPCHEYAVFHSHEGSIPLANQHRLHYPELHITTHSKIAILGLNGAGKSTLLRHILTHQRTKKAFYMQQELTIEDHKDLRLQLTALDDEKKAQVLQIVARLGSDAKDILASQSFSPGEARKIAIATAIVEGTEILFLDEPTNHLDLASIERLTQGLKASNLAMVIISHDMPFVDAVCTTKWHIERPEERDGFVVIRSC